MKKPARMIPGLFLALALAAAFPDPSRAGEPGAGPVSMAFRDWDGYYQVEGSFFVKADAALVWQVLTDYDHIPRFVSSMKESRVLSRDNGNLVLEQQAEGGFLFFTQRARLTLLVTETPESSITFQNTDFRDFDVYWGDWNLEPRADGVEVGYRVWVHPNFSAPLAGDILHGSSKDLMEAVRREILNRQAGELKQASSPTPVPPGPRENL